MPNVFIIAGPNGTGKTTSAPALLNHTLKIDHFVNADAIAAGLSAFAPEKVAMQAGRAMLTRMHYLATENENFAFETTLASRSFAPWINSLKQAGYCFHLTFLMLHSADLAVFRVAERVKMGGHSVPEDVIRRRYDAGLKNFFNLYAPMADSWSICDNSVMGYLVEIASKLDQQLYIADPIIWQKLVEQYDDTNRTR